MLDEFPDDVAALNDLGYIWADQNVRLQRAHRMIRQAVEEDPQNAAYRDSLGWVLYRLGRPEEALVELEKAAADGEPDPVILDHLGDVYHATNQPQKATASIDRLEQILVDCTGQDKERIHRDTDRDYYLSSEEAKEYGLIDSIVTPASAVVGTGESSDS